MIRFRVDPGDVPEAAAARRIGLSEPQFAAIKDRLFSRGFPHPDPDTGNYDLDAIDQWRKLRHPHLFGTQPQIGPAGEGVVQQRLAALKRGA